MARPSKPIPPAYRDQPDDEDLIELPTPDAGPAAINDLALPPPYSDDEDTTQTYRMPQNEYMIPLLDFAQRLSDGTHVIFGGFENEEWSTSTFENDIRSWAAIPPMKMVDILGTHTETVNKNKKTEQTTVTDFHIKLRLTEYLFTHAGRSTMTQLRTAEDHDRVHRGTVLKQDAGRKSAIASVEDQKPTLGEWCQRFQADPHKLKVFSLTRAVSGLNEPQLVEKITSLIRSTNYKGRVNVTFPIENPGVQVWSVHWINRWRHNMAICLVFYISMLWLITWPILFFTTKKYAVVKAVWAFSEPDVRGRPQYATMSEAQWFTRWQQAIERAVVRRQQGVLTEEDLTGAEREPCFVPTGHAGVDAAAAYLGVGLQAYQQVNRQLGWGYDT